MSVSPKYNHHSPELSRTHTQRRKQTNVKGKKILYSILKHTIHTEAKQKAFELPYYHLLGQQGMAQW